MQWLTRIFNEIPPQRLTPCQFISLGEPALLMCASVCVTVRALCGISLNISISDKSGIVFHRKLDLIGLQFYLLSSFFAAIKSFSVFVIVAVVDFGGALPQIGSQLLTKTKTAEHWALNPCDWLSTATA